MKKMSQQISQEELTAKTLRRIYNRGKRKGYVSPEYIEKTVIQRQLLKKVFQHAMAPS